MISSSLLLPLLLLLSSFLSLSLFPSLSASIPFLSDAEITDIYNNYSNLEWQYWDSYSPFSSYPSRAPTVPPPSDPVNYAKFDWLFRRAFFTDTNRGSFINQYHQFIKDNQAGRDYCVLDNGRMDVKLGMLNVSFVLFTGAARRRIADGWTSASLPTASNLADPTWWQTNVAGATDAIAWLEACATNHLFNYQLRSSSTPSTYGRYPWATGGSDEIFYTVWVAQMSAHFLSLASSSFLSAVAVASSASLTSLYHAELSTYSPYNAPQLGYPSDSSAQWMLRTAGFSTHAAAVDKALFLLNQRGAPLPLGLGNSTMPSNKDAGVWTPADYSSTAAYLTNSMVQWTVRNGFREFGGTVYNYYFLNIASIGLIHALNSAVEDDLLFLYQKRFQEVAFSFFPLNNLLSAPAHRFYDIIEGTSPVTDQHYAAYYFEMLFPPHCWRYSPGGADKSHCVSPSLPADQINSNNVNMPLWPGDGTYSPSMMLGIWQTAQGIYHPFSLFSSFLPDRSIYRWVASRSGGPLPGQSYFNFVATNWTMGFTSDTGVSGQVTTSFLARLGGAQDMSATPPLSPQDSPRNTLQQVLLQMLISATPDAWDQSGASPRTYFAQRDGWALWSSFASPFPQTQACTSPQFPPNPSTSQSLSQTILLPLLASGGLWANGQRLPTAVGTQIALPLLTTFEIVHGNHVLAIRVLYAEYSRVAGTSAALKDVPVNTPVAFTEWDCRDLTHAPGSEPYVLMYIVSPTAITVSSGAKGPANYFNSARLVLTHKKAGDPSTIGYYTVWAAGLASASPGQGVDRSAVHWTLALAPFSLSLVTEPQWTNNSFILFQRSAVAQSYKNRYMSLPSPYWADSWAVLNVSLNLGGSVLAVNRQDNYDSEPQNKVFCGLEDGQQKYPYWTRGQGTVDGVLMASDSPVGFTATTAPGSSYSLFNPAVLWGRVAGMMGTWNCSTTDTDAVTGSVIRSAVTTETATATAPTAPIIVTTFNLAPFSAVGVNNIPYNQGLTNGWSVFTTNRLVMDQGWVDQTGRSVNTHIDCSK